MSFLDDILARKRVEVDERRRAIPDRELEARVRVMPATQSLAAALSPRRGPVKVIAEVKRASPSVGQIRAGLDPEALAIEYARAGAAAISVLTDGPGFGGSLGDLESVQASVSIPVLRKDFILDPYQLLEARLAGADAVLLIVAALPLDTLISLQAQAAALGLDALVEVHDEPELETALAAKSRLIGINNRNLKTFQVDLAVSERLLPRIGDQALAVAESGIRAPADVTRLRRAGAANFLVGEALVRAESAARLLAELQEAM